MEILRDKNIKEFNTFGVEAQAKFLVVVNSEADFEELLTTDEFQNNEKLFLGGGSNVLITRNFDGLVVINNIKGIDILNENEEEVLIKANSGENWHDFVEFTVGRGYWGIENLALIPGTVGAAPMQNIGAYGVELRETLVNVEALNIKNGEKRIFQNEECDFGYRSSVFKNTLKGEYFISAITLKLSKLENKKINYAVLQNYLADNNIEVAHSRDVASAVSSIRRTKLPDPKILGNAGSFFKNSFVEKEKLEELKINYPEIPSFEEGGRFKIPSAWLIEQCGYKGKKEGNVGMHERQALVLVNYGGATGQEIKDFSDRVISSVKEKFGIALEKEVNLI